MKYFLFDLDGTLVDTAPDLCDVLNKVLQQGGFAPIKLDVVRGFIGAGAKAMLRCGLEANGVKFETFDPYRFETMWRTFLSLYADNIAEHSEPYPHVVDTLKRLNAAGCHMGVVTNKTEHLATKLLNALDLSKFFTCVVGGNTLPVPKPSARPLHAALWRMKDGTLEDLCSHAVMVGDSATDVTAAYHANIRSIVVPYGYTDIPAGDLGADMLINNFRELLSLVRTHV